MTKIVNEYPRARAPEQSQQQIRAMLRLGRQRLSTKIDLRAPCAIRALAVTTFEPIATATAPRMTAAE
jgi:hypothetical protein